MRNCLVRVRANAAEIQKPDDSVGRKASESGYISEEDKRPEGQLQEVKRPEGKKPEDKPPEDKRSVKKNPEDELLDDKKQEDKQSDDKRPEDKIRDDKRPEDKRQEDKRPEDKRNEEVKRTGEKIPEDKTPVDKLTVLPKGAIENIVQNSLISPSTSLILFKAEASRQTVGTIQSVQDGINSLAGLDIPGSPLDSTKIPGSPLGSRKEEEEEDCYLIIESPDMFKDDIAPTVEDPIDQRLESGCLTTEGASDVTVGDTDVVGSSTDVTGDVSGKSDVTAGTTGDVVTGAADVITGEPGEAQVARTKSLLMSLLGGGAGTTTASPSTRHGGTQAARHGGPRESHLADDPACPSQFLVERREEGETLLELAQSLLVRQWKLVATTRIHQSQVVSEYSVCWLWEGRGRVGKKTVCHVGSTIMNLNFILLCKPA